MGHGRGVTRAILEVTRHIVIVWGCPRGPFTGNTGGSKGSGKGLVRMGISGGHVILSIFRSNFVADEQLLIRRSV